MTATEKKLEVAQDKLNEVRLKFDTDKNRLDEWLKKRGELKAKSIISGQTDQKQLAEIDRSIIELRSELDGVPDIIAALSAELARLKEQQSRETREADLAKQKKIAAEIAAASGELIEFLRVAVEQHKKLKRLYEIFWELGRKTESIGGFLSNFVCTGIYTCELENVYELCLLEVQGKTAPRPPAPVAAPTMPRDAKAPADGSLIPSEAVSQAPGPQTPLAEALGRKP